MQDNTPNTEIYFPKPTKSPLRDNSCSGDRLRSISYAEPRPGQSSERHQAPHRVVCVPYIQADCFENPGGACQHRQSTELLEGPSRREEDVLYWTRTRGSPACLEEAEVYHNLGGKVNLPAMTQKSRITNQSGSPAKFRFQKPGGAISM